MTPRHLPLHSISITNFRCLSGSTAISLDAPVVLIHGSNGTGKTTILAAIEMALTGQIGSLRRLDRRYQAYLPHHGTPFATLKMHTTDPAGHARTSGVITVGPEGFRGTPALEIAAREFYSERCYLDQVSLGRLLEIYQHTGRNKESLLARFVNELLGLDQIDALMSGLIDVTDVRRLRRLIPAYRDTENTIKVLETEVGKFSSQRVQCQFESRNVKEDLTRALSRLDVNQVSLNTIEDLAEMRLKVSRMSLTREVVAVDSMLQYLSELRGRLNALANRPSHIRIEEAKRRQQDAVQAYDSWAAKQEPALRKLLSAATSLGAMTVVTDRSVTEEVERLADVLDLTLKKLSGEIDLQEKVVKQMGEVGQQIGSIRERMQSLDAEIKRSEERVGNVVTTLARLRQELVGEICPVCDRDYSEVSDASLGSHLDAKIQHMTTQGEVLQELRQERLTLQKDLGVANRLYQELHHQAFSDDQATSKKLLLERLRELRLQTTRSAATTNEGRTLARHLKEARDHLEELGYLKAEHKDITKRLKEAAEELRTHGPLPEESLEETWSRLQNKALASQETARTRADAKSRALDYLADLEALQKEQMTIEKAISDKTNEILHNRDRLKEASHRRRVAREVRDAASEARAMIVERVFTESLNRVWKNIFRRLAPHEPFVPEFGVPEAGKHFLSINLQTLHQSGIVSGTPGAMLSAGNLNTAALSLFMALHFAVAPKIRCLILDDPVQSMDEVHISQFAGLLRLLSKRHGRQIILAVHKRELFQYLALELSPAFRGDALLTIELSLGPDGNPKVETNRIAWQPDQAVA